MKKHLTIICVDDDPAILKSLGDQLRRRFSKQYNIELACSGEDALILCEELVEEGQRIPLIISDQKMQGMKGDRLLIQLHELYPDALKIMLTGQADADSIGNVVNASALYRYIAKPWDEASLVLTVSEALHQFERTEKLSEQNQLLRENNDKLNTSLSLLLSTLESTVDGILVLDMEGNLVSYNQKFCHIWNFSDQGPTLSESELFEKIETQLKIDEARLFKAALLSSQTKQHNTVFLKDDRIIEYSLRPQQLMGEIVGKVWSFRDVTQEKTEQARLKHQAWHDSLTDLPNRLYFSDKLESAIDHAQMQSEGLCVMFIDLDRFKVINDTYGHAIGDGLLKSAVEKFLDCLRDGDLLARWGGDEFVLLITSLTEIKGAEAIAKRLLKSVQAPFYVEGYELEIGTSIGISMYPHDGTDSHSLLQHADIALYQAKRSGRNQYCTFNAELDCLVPSPTETKIMR